MRGDPSDEELAALTAVVVVSLASAGSAGVVTASPSAPRSAWADPAHRLRTPLHPGPGAWRASMRPH
ncbi:MAG: acyl-CoA carboxylase subunit epsilon [Pseudonocardiaceae bacterium]